MSLDDCTIRVQAVFCVPLYTEDERYGVTNGVIFNVGGPVWSMAWAPSGDVSPSNIQYIAMAAYRTLDETYRMDVPLKHNGLIQLWSTSLGDQSQ